MEEPCWRAISTAAEEEEESWRLWRIWILRENRRLQQKYLMTLFMRPLQKVLRTQASQGAIVLEMFLNVKGLGSAVVGVNRFLGHWI
jgi:hypothetical protein